MKSKLILLAIVLAIACKENRIIRTGLEGQFLPNFNVMLAGRNTQMHSSAIPEGKPVVLFYFDPGCPFCKAQMEEIVSDMEQLKDIQFLLVTQYPGEHLTSFLNRFNTEQYQNLLIGTDSTDYLGMYFKIQEVPYLAVYDKNKILQQAFIGKVATRELARVAGN